VDGTSRTTTNPSQISLLRHPKQRRSVRVASPLGESTSIKFALIDEILFVPPVPIDGNQRELQRWQGSGVIDEINNLRRDIQLRPQTREEATL
jgi:hypothetical protein